MISGVVNQKLKCIEEHESLPAILVAVQDGLRQRLAHDLAADGYLVFEVKNETEALHFVITHSRPIGLLVADTNVIGYKFATALKAYRREMQIVFVPAHSRTPLALRDSETALVRVRQLVRPSKKLAADGQKEPLIEPTAGVAHLLGFEDTRSYAC